MRLIAAIVLLALGVCAVEVGLRVSRVRSRVTTPASATVGEQITSPDQTTFIRVRPLLDLKLTTLAGRQLVIRTNELGIRGPTVQIPKPRGTYRILCLGSGDTFGMGIDQRETFPHLLQSELALQTRLSVEVINAGCPGAGPLANLLRLRQRFVALQPDLVIVNLKPEDLILDDSVRGTLRLDETGTPAYAVHPTFAATSSDIVNGLCNELLIADWSVEKCGEFFGLHREALTSPQVSAQPFSAQQRFASIHQVFEIVSGIYGSTVVSISPSAWSLEPRIGKEDSMNPLALERDLRATLGSADLLRRIAVHNSTVEFQNDSDPRRLFSPRTGYFSVEGNRLHGASLARFLVGVIPGIWSDSPRLPVPNVLPNLPQDLESSMRREPVQQLPRREGSREDGPLANPSLDRTVIR